MGKTYLKVIHPLINDKFIIIFDKRGLFGYLSIVWYIFTQKPKPGNKKYLRKLGLAYGYISFEADHLSIGAFSLKYSNILKIELSRKKLQFAGSTFILIYVIKEITYWIIPLHLRGTLNSVFPILMGIISLKLFREYIYNIMIYTKLYLLKIK